MSLPDYVLTEAEDRARTRYLTPSNISPWADGVSMSGLGTRQCDELRRRGIDPATVDWLFVTIPVTDPFEFDTLTYGRAVQKIAAPIIGHQGDRINVLTPKGRPRYVYAGGQLSRPRKRRAGGWIGRG